MKIYWNGESKNIVGERVKTLRKEVGFTQKLLSEKLQLLGYEFSALTILRIEQGKRFVPDYEVVALARYFDVSVDYLLGLSSQKKRFNQT